MGQRQARECDQDEGLVPTCVGSCRALSQALRLVSMCWYHDVMLWPPGWAPQAARAPCGSLVGIVRCKQPYQSVQGHLYKQSQ
jgi:hypothetical protein